MKSRKSVSRKSKPRKSDSEITVTSKGEQILSLLKKHGPMFAAEISNMKFQGPTGPVLTMLLNHGLVEKRDKQWGLTKKGEEHPSPVSPIVLSDHEAAQLVRDPLAAVLHLRKTRWLQSIEKALDDILHELPLGVDVSGMTAVVNGVNAKVTVTFGGNRTTEIKLPSGNAS